MKNCAMSLAALIAASAFADAIDDGAFLHLDAASGKFDIVADANGDARITKWYDVRRSSSAYAIAGVPYGESGNSYAACKAYPKLVTENGLNGMPVVDCGAYYQLNGYTSDDAGYFLLSERASVREGFLVFRNKEANKNAFFLGDQWEYRFHRGNSGEILWSGDGWSAGAYPGATWKLDGDTVDAASATLDTGYHLVSFSLPSGMEANSLTLDRHNNGDVIRIGGIEYAEVILFTSELTAERRSAIEAALTAKWFGASPDVPTLAIANFSASGQSSAGIGYDGDASIDFASAAGTFAKSGAGGLSVGALSGATAINVEAGSLSLAYDTMNRAFFHIDPSDSSSVDLDQSGNVAKIYDIDGRSVSAAPDSYAKSNPTLQDYGELKVLDFGTFYVEGNGDMSGAPDDSSDMIWSSVGYDMHTFFIVVGTNPDSSGNEGDQFLLCDTQNSNYFDRSNKMLIDSTWSQWQARDAKWWLDGENVESPTTTALPSGMHLVTIAIPSEWAGATVNSFCLNVNHNRLGGIRYGELAVFAERLDDDEIIKINEYLLEKWFDWTEPTAADILDDAVFHIDPSNSSTLTIEDGKVVRIDDVSFNGVYAGKSAMSKSGATIVQNGPNDMDMLDFGAETWVRGVSEGDIFDDCCGFTFNSEITSAKTLFAIVEKKGEHDAFVFGSSGENYDFHADNGYLINYANNTEAIRNAYWSLDGVSVSPSTTPFTNDAPHLVAIRLPSSGYNATVGALAQDREMVSQGELITCRIGGMRYGEVAIFDRILSDYEMKIVTAHLLEKWLATSADTFSGASYATVSIGAGANLIHTGNLAIADDSTIAVGWPSTYPITVAGECSLGSGVSLSVAGASSAKASGSIRIVSATSLLGAENLSTWMVGGSALEGRRYSLSARSNAVYLDIVPTGTVIIIK